MLTDRLPTSSQQTDQHKYIPTIDDDAVTDLGFEGAFDPAQQAE